MQPASKRLIGSGLAAALAIAGAMAAKYEGTRYRAYQDTGGVWTICRGHTRGVREGDVASEEQCAEYQRADTAIADAEVNRCIAAQLTTNQRAAFDDFEFNTGRICGSSIARHANSGNIRAACAAIGLYMYAGGKDCRVAASNCPGIVTRRQDEMRTCWPSFANVVAG